MSQIIKSLLAGSAACCVGLWLLKEMEIAVNVEKFKTENPFTALSIQSVDALCGNQSNNALKQAAYMAAKIRNREEVMLQDSWNGLRCIAKQSIDSVVSTTVQMVKAIAEAGGRLALELAHQMHESERARERAALHESRAAAKQRQVSEQRSKAECADQSELIKKVQEQLQQARARLRNQAAQQQASSQAVLLQ